MPVKLIAILFLILMPACTTADVYKREFQLWAKKAMQPVLVKSAEGDWHDLEPLGEMIGEARLVSLTESAHCVAEPLEFRNRLIAYLVAKKGFTAIAIESGMTEGQVVHEYVRGGPGNLDQVVEDGFSWGFSKAVANKELVQYLRRINQERDHKVNFYGFDVSGSPKNNAVKWPPSVALQAVLKYLDTAAPEDALQYRKRVAHYLKYIKTNAFFNFQKNPRLTIHDYAELTSDDRHKLTTAIADIIDFLEREELQLVRGSSEHDYQWAYRNALSARQVDAFLRKIPDGPEGYGLTPDDVRSKEQFWSGISQESRDRFQADNIEWVLRREGPEAKIMVFAHRSHLAMMPVAMSMKSRVRKLDSYGSKAGQYLKKRYGNELVTVLSSSNGGHVGCNASDFAVPIQAMRGSFDYLLSEISSDSYFLDLRQAPAKIEQWLRKPRSFVTSLGSGENKVVRSLKFRVLGAFDIAVFMRDLTPAQP